MEPEQVSQEPEVNVEPKQSAWNTVTPLSKYLAMALFIILPFLGGYIGYNFAPEKVVVIEGVVDAEIKNESQEEVTSQEGAFGFKDTSQLKDVLSSSESYIQVIDNTYPSIGLEMWTHSIVEENKEQGISLVLKNDTTSCLVSDSFDMTEEYSEFLIKETCAMKQGDEAVLYLLRNTDKNILALSNPFQIAAPEAAEEWLKVGERIVFEESNLSFVPPQNTEAVSKTDEKISIYYTEGVVNMYLDVYPGAVMEASTAELLSSSTIALGTKELVLYKEDNREWWGNADELGLIYDQSTIGKPSLTIFVEDGPDNTTYIEMPYYTKVQMAFADDFLASLELLTD